ncbi:DNA repair helicase [Schizopora paradoxa]|uniref:ATP-dependent DNA helicase CHL1 n=1 Tax=Schizopora paradoxa TaxID=27342 RepID=A0A0H2R6J5_9AGAM|nr:DNA repair helicase [Schizopora paradoxa]
MQKDSSEAAGPSGSRNEVSLTLSLPTPSSFPAFPYTTPYPIQLELMRHLYEAIESRRFAIVESPTGTGKTLSLLCATLTWLEDDRRRIQKGKVRALEGDSDDGEPEWVRAQTVKRLKDQLLQAELEMNERLRMAKEKEAERKRELTEITNGDSRRTKRRVRICTLSPRIAEPNESEQEDKEFLPRDFDEGSNDFVSATLRKVLQATRKPDRKESSNSEDDGGTKIFFASRTHSQLAQVLSELARINMQVLSLHDLDASEPSKPLKSPQGSDNPHPRTVSLASRKHLCINDDLRAKVARKGRGGDLDDACRDLRNEKGCPYLPPPETDSRMEDTRNAILATPKDIEDLVSTGNAFHACPYYAARSAVIALPYNLLLSANSREALDIKLKDQIVVVDEAHNLPETLLSLHTVELTVASIKASTRAAEGYLSRFKTRLGATHALHLKRFVRFLREVEGFVKGRECDSNQRPSGSNVKGKETAKTNAQPESNVMMAPAFLEEVGRAVDGINFLELRNYLQSSKAAQKISAYAKRCATKEAEEKRQGPSVKIGTERNKNTIEMAGEMQASAIYAVEAFLCSLMNDKEDGRVIITYEGHGSSRKVHSIKYQHLNPATYFADVVAEARCVVLAGGTMSPIPDMTAQLFPSIADDRLSVFSCGHIIPPANLKCIVVGKGPKGRELVLKFGQRDSEDMLDEIGQLLANLVTLVPKGLVVFFPSYSYLENAKSFWTRSGLLERLSKKKALFYEPQSTSDVDAVLHAYSLAVHDTSQNTTGALLMAVVGAKLSEGLNFADDLARAVVVVGLPYPNLASTELKERMKYVSNLQKKTNGKGSGRDPGAELYENLCMRAVNQSIGRAIRHKDDWASLILVDARYASQRVRSKLPRWIDESTVVTDTFGQVVKELSGFFRSKRK